jgi:hypothetical protein
MRDCRTRFRVAHELAGLHPGVARGIELLADVRQEQHVGPRQGRVEQDLFVRRRFFLAADARVEIAGEQRREVAVRGVAEDQLLRLDRARRIHVEPQPALVPLPQLLRRIRVDVALELAGLVARAPDQALQLLQRRDLAILVDPLLEDARGFIDRQLAALEPRNLGELLADRRVARMGLQEFAQPLARIRKQRLVDEVDRGGGALDVRENGFDQAAFASL